MPAQNRTEIQALERQLHASEQRLRAIVATAADGIVTINRQGIIQDFTPSAERLFERPASSMIGHDVRELLPLKPPLETCFAQLYSPLSRHERRRSPRPIELLGQRSDGSEFPIELTLSAVEGLDLYVAILRDISERRQLEREIIEISTAEQERIGHDIHDGIGQQLTALGMLASSLERRLAARAQHQDAADAHTLAVHLNDTLGAARALARGLSPVEIAPEGLGTVLADLVEHVGESAGIHWSCQVDPDAQVHDTLSAVHLYRIAQEALSNAVRHAQPSRIEVVLDSCETGLVLEIRDNGSGIEHIDERRGRLGLHIMHYRAALIGGALHVEKMPAGGTRVRCSVPLRH